MQRSGIDVSKWQGDIDWAKVKASGQVEFVLIRAGYGDALKYPSQIDQKFERNYKGCKDNGIPVGVYWYSYATTPEMARAEARACIAALKGKRFEYPIYYDVEEMRIFKTGKTNEIIKAFCDEMEKAGFWVGIYIYRAAVQQYLSEYTRTRWALAIAEYASKLHYTGQCGIWQNSSTWKVDGISGNVDHDWCYVDYPKLIKEKGKNGYPKTTSFRVAATVPVDLYFAKDGKPPVDVQYKVGQQCTIEQVITIGNETWGKVQGRDSWVDLSKMVRV
jgi:GH25 family lysozyme M1 (1,4-beta-N-acetylmuramidase)